MSSDELLWRTKYSSSRYQRYESVEQRTPLNASALHWQRQQFGCDVDEQLRRRLQASPAYVDRLEQEAVLAGHEGCVNCLEWSTDGLLLASGSDDYKVIIWDPFRKRRIHTINTKHVGNIFSVKFMPRHNNSIVATCGADKFIYVYDVNHENETLFTCNCHTMRPKRLATAPDSPYVFWSAGEDGVILQLDMREPHRCRSGEDQQSTANGGVRLLSLSTQVESTTEAKCLAINPRRTEYLAVGANDPYARVFDRRMLPDEASSCVSYYAPGQIVKNISRNIMHESRTVTYLTFNNYNSTELLVNMGCEHVYRYDIHNAAPPIFYELPEYTASPPPETEEQERNQGDNGESRAAAIGATSKKEHKRRTLPTSIEQHKKLGNEHLENGKLLAAIDAYSAALAEYPQGEVLYLNRATALLRRGWFGDVYAALRDCHKALRLDPTYVKAYFRLARALLELHRPQEADKCLQELIQRFPSFANNHGVLMLHKDIRENRQQQQQAQQQAQRRTSTEEPVFLESGLSYLRLTDDEYALRRSSKDYKQRYVGHCNITTDIKEANYLGLNGEFIAAGSDDGNFYIWEGETAKIRAVYRADTAIVNCVQPHPSICMLATSGIDHDIKIWSPCAPSAAERPNLIADVARYVEVNQEKMRSDPFELNTRNAYCFNN